MSADNPVSSNGAPAWPAEEVVPGPALHGVTPELPPQPPDLPPPSVRLPRPPHPGFWWSLVWCVGFLL
ncbi:MAG TPA: hypothetical protein VFE78_38390, partial [Gemmataceae bacterium]|nr:hypothetical protein [Gemmataceae bacterium]